jgi:hypothetical protein
VVALNVRNAITVGEESFDQHNQGTVVGCPTYGLVQGQRNMVAVAALATAVAGKMNIHGDIHDRNPSGSVRWPAPDVTFETNINTSNSNILKVVICMVYYF